MWAFLIYDVEEKKIFGSRDRFGVKPLYRYSSRDQILFGSEIKAILHSGYYNADINLEVAARFLVQDLLDVDNKTFYTGIEQIPAGSAFELYLDGRQRTWFYWSLDSIGKEQVTDPCDAFKCVFDDAVRLRMRSDVPVGVCLSGGLDSTSILCTMARVRANASSPLEAFSFISADHDESAYISDTINLTGAHLNRLEVNPATIVSRLEKALWYHDEPLHSLTALVGFELMSLAAQKGVKVILNGQGADETIAGYHSYFSMYWAEMFGRKEYSLVWQEIVKYSSIFGSKPYRMFLGVLRSVLADGVSQLPLYREVAALRRRMSVDRNGWFTPEFLAHLRIDKTTRPSSLDDVLKLSIRRHPLPLFLRIEDRNSMAHSVEARLPFLDYRLVTLMFKLSSRWKMNGPWNKYILRQAMTGVIPESVRVRVDKMGFPVPSRRWLTTALFEPFNDLLASREMRESGLYNVNAIRKSLELQRKPGNGDLSTPLFNIAQLQLWSRDHSKRVSVQT
jgi:asparagine synthase (glutamine-hydrolysing)